DAYHWSAQAFVTSRRDVRGDVGSPSSRQLVLLDGDESSSLRDRLLDEFPVPWHQGPQVDHLCLPAVCLRGGFDSDRYGLAESDDGEVISVPHDLAHAKGKDRSLVRLEVL